MNASRLFLSLRRPRQITAALLPLLLALVAISWPQNAAAQKPAVPKLTLSQVEELVSHHVPDSTMSTQIQRRGLAFSPTVAVVESLRAKGAGPLTLAAIEALSPKANAGAQASKPASSAKSAGAKPQTPTAHRNQSRLGTGKVEVSTEPGSQLVLDGRDVGSAGADGSFVLPDVVEGQHELVVTKENYRETSATFLLAKNEDKQLSLPMEWLGGFLSVSAEPAGSSIHVTGSRYLEGQFSNVKFPSGSYTVTVSSIGYIAQTRQFQIGAGEHHVEQIQLAIDLVDAKAKADVGDDAGLEILKQAVARGEEVICNVKLTSVDMAVGAYMYDGTVTVSSRGVSFRRVGGDRYKPDFTVSPDKILGLTYENPQPAQDINLRVAILNRKGKQDKYTYQLYNSGAALVVVGSSGPTNVVNIACNGCDQSLNVLYALLEKVRNKN